MHEFRENKSTAKITQTTVHDGVLSISQPTKSVKCTYIVNVALALHNPQMFQRCSVVAIWLLVSVVAVNAVLGKT